MANSYLWSPHKISMTEKEIELAMKGLFKGASKVRARRYEKKIFNNFNRELRARIATQKSKEEMNDLKVA